MCNQEGTRDGSRERGLEGAEGAWHGRDGRCRIHALATPTSQACVNATKTIPILISSVTDLVGVGLMQSLERPGGNVTGTTHRSPVDRQLDLPVEIVPNLKRLGFIYNSGEVNPVSWLNELRAEAYKRSIQVVVEATVTNSSGVFQAAQSLVGRVDAVPTPTDNTVVAAFQSVVKVCEDNKIPHLIRISPGPGCFQRSAGREAHHGEKDRFRVHPVCGNRRGVPGIGQVGAAALGS